MPSVKPGEAAADNLMGLGADISVTIRRAMKRWLNSTGATVPSTASFVLSGQSTEISLP